MPVPSARKQFRQLLLAEQSSVTPILPTNELLRRDVAGAFSNLMCSVSGGFINRHIKAAGIYKADLHSIRTARLELIANQQAAAAQALQAQQGQVPVPAALIRIAWVWLARFAVYKPKKQKKNWIDVAEVVADSAEQVEQAARFLCERKGWEFKHILGGQPSSVAYSYHVETLESLSKQQEAVVPWPAAFGSMQ